MSTGLIPHLDRRRSARIPIGRERRGAGMADDHMNVAVASDGTLYAAVKTSYDTAGYPKMACWSAGRSAPGTTCTA